MVSVQMQITPQGQGGRTSHDKFAAVTGTLHVDAQSVTGGALSIGRAASVHFDTNVIVIQSNRRRAVLVISH
jgi:hypothetical protein